MQEGPARDAILAISLLYESSYSATPLVSHRKEQRTAVVYYNRAMRHVATENFDTETVLYLSILFTCVELLRYNAPAAIQHCRHAVRIFKGSDKKRLPLSLSAVIRQLAGFPYFLGDTLSESPLLPHDGIACHGFHSAPEATEALDSLMLRTITVVREVDPLRKGLLAAFVLQAPWLAKWRSLRQDLDAWYAGLAVLRVQQQATSDGEWLSLYRVLEMRWLISDIWVDSRLFPNETIYDAYRGQFERVANLARDEAHSRKSLGATDTRKFRFESKWAPQLHFAVLKCRFLPERLHFLALFKKLAYQREALWDAVQMEAIGRRVIEREHGIELASESIDSLLDSPMDALTLPSEGQRIMDYLIDGETETYTSPSGSKVSRRSICFLYRPNRQGPVEKAKDWITLQSLSS
ncbi:hypothetical protein PG984_008460 [Apiospora sp. TS-2023a]